MNRRTFLLNMCRHADGTVDETRFAHLCNRWSPQARAASLGVRFARYGSGFAPTARAAAAASAKAGRHSGRGRSRRDFRRKRVGVQGRAATARRPARSWPPAGVTDSFRRADKRPGASLV